MKKSILLLVVLMLVCALVLCACEKKDEGYVEDIVLERYYEEADLPKLTVSVNGGSVKMDDKFEDVKDNLGTEIKAPQAYTPCGGSDDEKMTTHYYDGLEIDVTHDGLICRAVISGFDNQESKASIAGIKLGDTPETVRANFATQPETDSEYTINYSFGSLILSFSLDTDGTGNVNYISLDDMDIAGV